MTKVFLALLTLAFVAACSSRVNDDADFRANIVGTWTTADVKLPDEAQVKDVESTFRADGTWTSQYTVTRAGSSRKQSTSGVWRVENGYMVEVQTNVDGITDTNAKPGASRIVQLDKREMVLSNYYSPRRVFVRRD